MKVLITGGAGFIGSHLVEQLTKQGAEVIVLDDFSTGNRQNLVGLPVKVIQGSTLNRLDVELAMRDGIDYVFHLAARTSVPQSMTDPHGYIDTNVFGLLNVLEVATISNVKKLVFASSSSVYGASRKRRQTETDRPRPKSPYAVTKLDGEHYCQIFSDFTSMRTVSLRFFNVYGPRQNPNGSYGAVIPFFMQNALKNDPLTIHGDGLQTRDFTYVKDVAEACVFAATKTKLKGVYNVSHSEENISVLKLADHIIEITGSSSKVMHAPNARATSCIPTPPRANFPLKALTAPPS